MQTDADDISDIAEDEDTHVIRTANVPESLRGKTVDFETEPEKPKPKPTCGSRLRRCMKSIEMCLDKIPFPQIRPCKCLRRPGLMNRMCEANRCCFFCGSRGCVLFGTLRKPILMLSLCLTMVSMLLRAMPAAALSSDTGNLNAWPWAYGRYVCIQKDMCEGLEANVFIGLEALLVDSTNFNIYKVIQWGADNCVENLSSLGAGSYCRICDYASKACAAMAFTSIATGLVNVWTDIQRMRAQNDHNCIKSLAIISNIFGALQLCLAVSIFHTFCVAEFPLEDAGQTFRIDLTMGKGGALIASASGVNFFNIVIHWLVPVPEARWKAGGDIDDDPAPHLWLTAATMNMSKVMPFDGAVPGGTLIGVEPERPKSRDSSEPEPAPV
ncbi:unnamed protein product [Effrenium voratum]|uniref:Transmembrane protein n=2 Tax=Effrenium voratum TaxID=2562239 RepID=A0AA36IEC0_9DINO|nr:unnamed protein product [Effrenium voratum]CAJ1384679.1 unnamed protein product [Effrenium voratum]